MSHLVEGRLRNAMAQLKREMDTERMAMPDCSYTVIWINGVCEVCETPPKPVEAAKPAKKKPPFMRRVSDGDQPDE